MGENKHINELDAFTKKYVKEIKRDTPSSNFTPNLMRKILEVEKSNVFAFKPLISKKTWAFIFIVFVVLLFIPFKESSESLFNLPEIDFSFINSLQTPSFLENISVSKSVLYAILFFGIMLIAQVFLLKNYFEKKFSNSI